MAGIKDVANEAGVSVATVSYVLNGTRSVSPETAKRVEAAAAKLKYSPNFTARTLRTRKDNVIAFITHRLTNDFFPEVIEAVANVLNANGYSLFLGLSQNRKEHELEEFQAMITRQVSGIIIAPTQMDFDYRSLCPSEQFPLVFVDRAAKAQKADSVRCDNYNVTYEAMCALIDRGHRNIAFMGPELDHNHNEIHLSTRQDRISGYRNALIDRGLLHEQDYYEKGMSTRENGYQLMQLILQDKRITATFISNGVMAQGALKCLQDANVDIPGEMALICFDAYNWSSLVKPTLSTIEQPTAEVGRLAAETILERIRNPEMTYRRIVLDSKLVLRASV